jgi:hypothetical protein
MAGISLKYKRLASAVIVLVAILALSAAADAQQGMQDTTYVVIGSSRIQGGNIQAARDQAISESLVTAVALMTEEVLKLDSLVENFSQVNKIIYDNTNDFVLDYKVLTEADSDRFYRVIVKATIAGKKITGQLSKAGILRAKIDLPAVLFFISEQDLQDDSPKYWWGKQMDGFESISEATMADILRSRGFSVIDHGDVAIGKMVDWGSDLTADLSDEQATNLGARLQADVVIVGTSIASPTVSVMGEELKSFKAILNARVLRTDTGDELANISRASITANVEESAGGREALKMAGVLAGEDLAVQLANEWRKLAEKPSQVEIVVEGTGNLANFVKFRRALTGISGVEGIRVKEIKPNETTLIIDYKGKTEELASALMLQNFENFGINIYEVGKQNLKIALISG